MISHPVPLICLHAGRKALDSGDELPGLLSEAESGSEPDSQDEEEEDEPDNYIDSRQQPGGGAAAEDYPYSDAEDETAGKHAKKKAARASGLKAGAPRVHAACPCHLFDYLGIERVAGLPCNP